MRLQIVQPEGHARSVVNDRQSAAEGRVKIFRTKNGLPLKKETKTDIAMGPNCKMLITFFFVAKMAV